MNNEVIKNLVSTIIPVFNRPKLVIEAVESVVAQTHPDIEILLVDDGSKDETPDVIDRLAREHSGVVRAFHIENSGPGIARETGRQHARGEFIQYLDSDDLLLPEKFSMQIESLASEPNVDVSYGKTMYKFDGKPSEQIAIKLTGERISTMFPGFIKERWWDTSTPLYRRSVSDAVGPWCDLICEEDWEYDCRVAALNINLAYCEDFVSVSRRHGGNQLSKQSALDPIMLASRARARERIWQSACRANQDPSVAEMQWFARYAFLLARQCGVAGLDEESRMLFELALEASTLERKNGSDFRIYRACTAILGWSNTARLADKMNWLRKLTSTST